MLRVGQRCEDIQKGEREEKAVKNYEGRSEIETLREAQEMVSGAAVDEDGDPITPTIAVDGADPTDEDAERKDVRTAADAEIFIGRETYLRGRRSTVSLAKFRPKRKTREEICQQVATEIGQISWHTVNKYWKEYRANLR